MKLLNGILIIKKCLLKKKKINYNLKSVYGSGHKYIYEEIYKSLNNQKSDAVNGKDGILSVNFIDKLYKKNNLL